MTGAIATWIVWPGFGYGLIGLTGPGLTGPGFGFSLGGVAGFVSGAIVGGVTCDRTSGFSFWPAVPLAAVVGGFFAPLIAYLLLVAAVAVTGAGP
jgi:hypothetical protein